MKNVSTILFLEVMVNRNKTIKTIVTATFTVGALSQISHLGASTNYHTQQTSSTQQQNHLKLIKQI